MVFKKKADKEINIGEQPSSEPEEKPASKKIKREEPLKPTPTPTPEPIITRITPLPIQPLPIVVPEPTVVTDVFTKYGGWVLKNGKIFLKEKFWSLTAEAKSGIIPDFQKPYTDSKSMASFSRQMKKQR